MLIPSLAFAISAAQPGLQYQFQARHTGGYRAVSINTVTSKDDASGPQHTYLGLKNHCRRGSLNTCCPAW